MKLRQAAKGALKSKTGRAFSGTREMLTHSEQGQKGPLGLAASPKQRNIPDREENRTVCKTMAVIPDREENRTVCETMAVSTKEHGSCVG